MYIHTYLHNSVDEPSNAEQCEEKIPKPKNEENLKKRFWDWSYGTMILVEV
jgi:hypothetical protein